MPSVIRSRQKGCVTRPPNAFMLFRSDFWAKEKLKDEPIERDHRDISRIAAICWNELDEEIKAVYRKKAEEQKKLHRLQHPEYRFSP
ncbi:High mobility group box domain containing protein, partial [Amanita muscaria]